MILLPVWRQHRCYMAEIYCVAVFNKHCKGKQFTIESKYGVKLGEQQERDMTTGCLL